MIKKQIQGGFRMKRTTLKMSFAGLMILVLFITSACSSSVGSKSTKAVELKMGHMNPIEHVQHSMAMAPFSEELAKVTEGRANFTIYPGAALAGPRETYDSIVTGIMDAGWGLQGYTAGKFSVHSVLHLPFMADGTGAELSIVAQKLYDQFPEIQKEYSDVKPLWFHAADPYAIITKGKAVRSYADVKGLKLRAPSVEAKSMIESWGATPVSFPAPEIYDALQKGVIDGALLPIAAIKDFNLFDAVDYVTMGNFNTSLFFVVMNKDSWNKFSPEDQKKMDELSGISMARKSGEAFDYQAKQAEKESKEVGVEFIALPDAELQKFKDASKIVTKNWISDMEAKGIPGQKIYDEAVKLIQSK
jgi:TRAP-type C4-dicarboxylate transport system substrate-binding protein